MRIDSGDFCSLAIVAEKKAEGAWIGLSDTATKGSYNWVDGTPYVYSDFTPDAFSWYSANIEKTRGKCVSMNISAGGWTYEDCSKLQPFTCKLKPNGKRLSLIFNLYSRRGGSRTTTDRGSRVISL